MSTFTRSRMLPGSSPAELFAWHCSPGALERLIPPGSGVRVVRRAAVTENSEVELSVPVAGFRRQWIARHTQVRAPDGFIDDQVTGPFASWRHEHRFTASSDGALLTDAVTYLPPGGPLAGLIDAKITCDLQRTFAWRHERTRRDLERQRPYRNRPRLTVGVTGATGLVAGELIPFLTTAGHAVRPFTRGSGRAGAIAWDPAHGQIDDGGIAGCDAIIHLAGSTVARRWSAAAQADIRASRIQGTRLVAEAVARAQGRVKTLIIASGINAYADSDDEQTEASPETGTGFLAGVVRDWEAAAEPARQAGVRVIHLRIGMVLSPNGGALAQLLTSARCGLGGPVGGGRQWLSWIDLDDLVGLIHFGLHEPTLAGVVNACSPHPVRQAQFATTLGSILRRPAFAPLPAFAVKLLLGQMGAELLLSSIRVRPQRAADAGFAFCSPDLVTALRFAIE